MKFTYCILASFSFVCAISVYTSEKWGIPLNTKTGFFYRLVGDQPQSEANKLPPTEQVESVNIGRYAKAGQLGEAQSVRLGEQRNILPAYSTNPIAGIPKFPPLLDRNGIAIGVYSESAQSFNIAIGNEAGRRSNKRFTILIGNGAQASNDHELVIKFLDGTELRQQLPTNTVWDLRGFDGWDHIK